MCEGRQLCIDRNGSDVKIYLIFGRCLDFKKTHWDFSKKWAFSKWSGLFQNIDLDYDLR